MQFPLITVPSSQFRHGKLNDYVTGTHLERYMGMYRNVGISRDKNDSFPVNGKLMRIDSRRGISVLSFIEIGCVFFSEKCYHNV